MYNRGVSPTLSVTIPTYNGARFVGESLNSILEQGFSDFEVIIVIDGSTDETESILKKFTDPRIRIVKKKENEGLPAAINTGLDASLGKYWCWTSDDNLYLPGAFQTMVAFLDANPHTAIVSPFLYHINVVDTERRISLDFNCFMCRRAAAIKAGKYRTEYMLVEDADFFLRMRHYFGPIARIRKPLYKFRNHPHSLSSTQIQKRQVVSTKMHYDLMKNGIEHGSPLVLFMDRISVATFYRGWEAVQGILQFADQEKITYSWILTKYANLLRTPIGLVINRIYIALITRYRRTKSFCCAIPPHLGTKRILVKKKSLGPSQ